MRALDVRDQPAVGTIDDDEIQRDRAAIIFKSDGDVGLVELLAQDSDRDGAQLPCRALHKKIVRLLRQGNPRGLQTRIKELTRCGGVTRQPAGEIGRTVTVVGVDIPDQRFRRTESRCGRGFEDGNNKNQNRSKYLCHRGSLYLRAALLYSCAPGITAGRKPKRKCVNCSMKPPENLRLIRRRRCGARRAGRAASAFTPMPAWSRCLTVLPSRSTTSRSARLPGVL